VRKMLTPPRVAVPTDPGSGSSHPSVRVTLSPPKPYSFGADNENDPNHDPGDASGAESPIRIDVRNSYMRRREEEADWGTAGGASASGSASTSGFVHDEPLLEFKGYSPGRNRSLLENFSSLSPPRQHSRASGGVADRGSPTAATVTAAASALSTVATASVTAGAPVTAAASVTAAAPVTAAASVTAAAPVTAAPHRPLPATPAPVTASLSFFDTTSTADKGRYIVNSARNYHTNSITRKQDILTGSDASGATRTLISSPGIILLCGRHKETNREHILTVLFDRTVFTSEEAAATWWELNKGRLLLIYR
jgi:hypothetical protein